MPPRVPPATSGCLEKYANAQVTVSRETVKGHSSSGRVLPPKGRSSLSSVAVSPFSSAGAQCCYCMFHVKHDGVDTPHDG